MTSKENTMPTRQRRFDPSRPGLGELAPALYEAVSAFEDELLDEDDDCADDVDEYEDEDVHHHSSHEVGASEYDEANAGSSRNPASGGRVDKRLPQGRSRGRRGPVWDDVDRDLRAEEVSVSRALMNLGGRVRPRIGALVPAVDQVVEEAYATDTTVPRDLRRVPTFPDPEMGGRGSSKQRKPARVKPPAAPDLDGETSQTYDDVATSGSQEVPVAVEGDLQWFHEHSLMLVSNASLRLRQGADIERFCGACESRLSDEELPEEVKVWMGSVRPSEVVMRL